MKCYIVRGKTIWKVFDLRYMTRKRPVMPRAACSSLWDWVIGRPSPSKVLLMMVYGDPRWSEYELQELKYRCWKRTLTKDQWRLLRVRIKNDARTDDDIRHVVSG